MALWHQQYYGLTQNFFLDGTPNQPKPGLCCGSAMEICQNLSQTTLAN